MSGILQIGTAGLLANQRALDTIAHNISNSSNPEYSRQETLMSTRSPINMGFGFLGTGVEVTSVNRVVDNFIIESMRGQQSNFSEVETFARFTEQVANLLADSTIGVSDGLNNFFASLQELSNDPASIPARQLFISNAQVLENRFQELAGQIDNELQNVNAEIDQIVNNINRIANNIADSNVRVITQSGGSSGVPNDLLDSRDALIQELSQYVKVSTTTQEDGSLNVFVGNGQTLVIGGNVTTLRTQPNTEDASRRDIAIVTPSGSTQNVTYSLSGGELGGLLQVYDSILTKTQNSLGRIATTISMALNEQHKLGIDINGDLGLNLFNDPNNFEAQFDRVLASTSNAGTGIFRASINPIARPNADTVQIFSDQTNIVDVGTLNGIATGLLNLNGINIRNTTAADDLLSTADNAASSIAIAKAINDSTSQHGVTASVETNTMYLGQFTSGAFAAGEFQINGVNIVTAGTTAQELVQDINALTLQTGVKAGFDSNNNITLYAEDGRNIQLTSNTNTPVATFEHFDTNNAVALDKIQRGGVHLTTTRNTIAVSGSAPASLGLTAGSVPAPTSSLTTSDYELEYDGTFYRVTRLSDNVIVTQSTSPNISVDGFTLTLESGTLQAGDKYFIKPVKDGSKSFDFRITDPLKLAMGLPVRVESSLSNKGNGSINLDSVLNTSGSPAATSGVYGNAFENSGELSPPIQIEFISPTRYRIMDISQGVPGSQIGPEQSYNPNQLSTPIFPLPGVVDSTAPGPNAPYTYDPGYRVSLSGTMQAGDTFSIGYNQDAQGDNRNSKEIIEIQLEKIMSSGTANFQDSYVQIIGDVGTQAAQAKVNSEASQTLLQSIKERRNEISGVNLDEEASNLIKYQQAYQAAAQIIVIARSSFDTLIRAFGG